MAHLLAVFKDTGFSLGLFCCFLVTGCKSPDSGFGGHFVRNMLGSKVGCRELVPFHFLNQLLTEFKQHMAVPRQLQITKMNVRNLY